MTRVGSQRHSKKYLCTVSSIDLPPANFEVTQQVLLPAGSRNLTTTKVEMTSFDFCSSSYDLFLLNIIKADRHTLHDKQQ
jgi:hypothetical protein